MAIKAEIMHSKAIAGKIPELKVCLVDAAQEYKENVMEFKTTAFAVFMIIVITYRNKKIADLEGREYRPYGIGDIVEFAPDIKYLAKKVRLFFRKRKAETSR
nr:hypothetical protein [uncultured Butyrivibrio sp.]